MQHYLKQYDKYRTQLTGHSQLREQALEKLNQLGLPNKTVYKTESWKYTNTQSIIDTPFELNFTEQTFDQKILQPYLLDNCYHIIFIDGKLIPNLSDTSNLNAECQSINLENNNIKPNRNINLDLPGFNALNTAFMQDGIVLFIKNNIKIEKPIQLIYLHTQNNQSMHHYRNLIHVGQSSEVEIIEHHIGLNNSDTFSTKITELSLDKNSQVKHYQIQQCSAENNHFNYLAIKQDKDSNLQSWQFDLGGKLIRNELRNEFLAPNAECHLQGLYILKNAQHVDNHTVINHAVANCTSTETYKGILEDNAHGVFNGQVIVAKDAQHSDASQHNNNLLLSNNAQINTKPQLEIFADDVKCAHGATIGQLDEKALFYLRARGIDTEAAKSLLTYGFALDIVHSVPLDNLQNYLSDQLLQCLSQGESIKELL